MRTTLAGTFGPRAVTVAVLALGALGVGGAVVVAKQRRTIEVTIPAGTMVVAALEHTVSTKKADVGDPIELQTREPLTLTEGRVIPAGVEITGEVTRSKGGGRIAGAPELTLRFTDLSVDGETYPISADPFRVKGKDDLGESVAEIGGGAVVGGLVGAAAGDVVKGAVIGAVLGTGVAVATDGGEIVLPADQRLRIRLAESVRVRYRPDASSEEEKEGGG